MSENPPRTVRLLLTLMIAATVAGCRGPARRGSRLLADPCSERLHEISRHLLVYYASHRRLPPTADHLLPRVDQAGLPPLVCPVSAKAYAYDPEGLEVPGLAGRLVLYDAEPAHSGMRWGIVVSPLPHGAGLVTQVVPVDEASLWESQQTEGLPARGEGG